MSTDIHQTNNCPYASYALRLGIASIFLVGIPGPIAVGLGIYALIEISRSDGRLKGTGKARAGMLVGTVTPPLYELIGYVVWQANTQ